MLNTHKSIETFWGPSERMNIKTPAQEIAAREKRVRIIEFISAVEQNQLIMVQNLSEELRYYRADDRIEIFSLAIKIAVEKELVDMLSKLFFLVGSKEIQEIAQQKRDMLVKAWRIAMNSSNFFTLECLWMVGKIRPVLTEPCNMHPTIAPAFLKHMENVIQFPIPVNEPEVKQSLRELYWGMKFLVHPGLRAELIDRAKRRELQTGWVLTNSSSSPLEENSFHLLPGKESHAPITSERVLGQPITAFAYAKLQSTISCKQQSWQVVQGGNLKQPGIQPAPDRKKYVAP
jgi:hypothetical protein